MNSMEKKSYLKELRDDVERNEKEMIFKQFGFQIINISNVLFSMLHVKSLGFLNQKCLQFRTNTICNNVHHQTNSLTTKQCRCNSFINNHSN